MFVLDTRLELSFEEAHLFSKYNLHSLVIYDSNAYTYHADTAYEHFDDATKVPLWGPSFTELASSLCNNVAGIAHGVMTAMSLRITLGDLVDGSHVECEDLGQLVGVEKNVGLAVRHLADYFAVALTFDGGEELREL